ncbi:hypothetical protein [Glycomyces sp. NPDC021274]|uniref:hypothetical protein n=1 Tax=Glycomyces sp. NPDC021274 TaxID=3155120 RepID=UPI00340D9FE2
MALYAQLHQAIAYDGNNTAEMLVFFDPVHSELGTWSVESEDDAALTLRCDFDPEPFGPQPSLYVVAEVGAVYTRVVDISGKAGFQGPWSPEDLAACLVEVPSAEAFATLADRVSALESGS